MIKSARHRFRISHDIKMLLISFSPLFVYFIFVAWLLLYEATVFFGKGFG